MTERPAPLSVIIVSGFVEAGKSTVLEHWMNHQESISKRCRHIVAQTQDDDLASVARLCRDPVIDYALLEAHGTTEPVDMVEKLATIAGPQQESRSLEVRALVTVVDTARFFVDYQGADDVTSRVPAAPADDDRTVSEVLIEQIEFANVIVLNKCDLTSADEAARLAAILACLNPNARIVPASFGQIPLETVLSMARFDVDRTARAAGWLHVLRGETVPREPRYGLQSFIYRARRPFHPIRLWEFLGEEWTGVVRSHGLVWLATRPDFAGLLSQAGGSCRLEPAGFWIAALPREDWPDDFMERDVIEKNWLPEIGDRRQELAFIGLDTNRDALEARLNACLLTDAEMHAGAAAWANLEDPFGDWGEACGGDCRHDH